APCHPDRRPNEDSGRGRRAPNTRTPTPRGGPIHPFSSDVIMDPLDNQWGDADSPSLRPLWRLLRRTVSSSSDDGPVFQKENRIAPCMTRALRDAVACPK